MQFTLFSLYMYLTFRFHNQLVNIFIWRRQNQVHRARTIKIVIMRRLQWYLHNVMFVSYIGVPRSLIFERREFFFGQLKCFACPRAMWNVYICHWFVPPVFLCHLLWAISFFSSNLKVSNKVYIPMIMVFVWQWYSHSIEF